MWLVSLNNKTFNLYFQVTSVDDVPPPLMELAPTNQTLPLQSVAILPCLARGTPSPHIQWHKNGTPLEVGSNPRISITLSGTLHIDGLYTNNKKFFLYKFFDLCNLCKSIVNTVESIVVGIPKFSNMKGR